MYKIENKNKLSDNIVFDYYKMMDINSMIDFVTIRYFITIKD
jgi:hypothetical protein